jgi:DUF1365 family protein
MHSCFYEGQVSHRRFTPRQHAFNYRLFYLYLDLDELDQVFHKRWLWSTQKPSLAWFRESDHIHEAGKSLKQTIYSLVEKNTGKTPGGPVRLLTQLRYFGYIFNPVSFYYCFDKNDTHVETIVAEVNNTPWGERHLYVLPGKDNLYSGDKMRFSRKKEFHVSPFMSMDIDYDWLFTSPEEKLGVHMENYQDDKKIFDATLGLVRKPINSKACASMLIRYPFMTMKVIMAIYWQALKLLLKKVPVFDHPDKDNYSPRGAD